MCTISQAGDVRLLAYADAYGIDAAVKLKKAKELAKDHDSPLGPGVMVLEACGVALYVFPMDRKLRGLWQLNQSRTRSRLSPDFSCTVSRYPLPRNMLNCSVSR